MASIRCGNLPPPPSLPPTLAAVIICVLLTTREDKSQPRDTHCVWFFGIVGHEACPILLRTRVHTFFLSDPRKAASLMPCGEHNTYWAVAITGEDIKVRLCRRVFVSACVCSVLREFIDSAMLCSRLANRSGSVLAGRPTYAGRLLDETQ